MRPPGNMDTWVQDAGREQRRMSARGGGPFIQPHFVGAIHRNQNRERVSERQFIRVSE